VAQLYSASSAHELMDQVVQCNNCSLEYVNPRPRADVIVGGYSDAVDPTFVAQNDDRIATFRRTLQGVLHKLSWHDGGGRKLLDIGCAGGAFAAARDLGFDPVGVEPSRWLADFGRRTYGLDVRDGVLGRGMFPEPSFDVITVWDVIEHVPEPHGLLSLAHDLLKPGGLLIVSYPDVGSVAARSLGSRWPFWLSVHLLYYTRGTMAKQLSRAGFDVEWFEPYLPTLQFGYVLQRAAAYIRPIAWLIPLAKKLGLADRPVTYNVGQTIVVCRKK
jgi:2-polyprenyl-3-methyl-5-hydroxy-6-metoxy-1,4-benzoquinol methylase